MSARIEIEAVEFLPGSFFGNPHEDEKIELILKHYEETKNEYLKTYANFSESDLRTAYFALQNRLSGK